jgi:hypothetical protein
MAKILTQKIDKQFQKNFCIKEITITPDRVTIKSTYDMNLLSKDAISDLI